MTRTADRATDASFGIVPVCRLGPEPRFLLIQHRAGHWGFPKGHAAPGETPLAAACREFEEETGIQRYQVDPRTRFAERYRFVRRGRRTDKTVVYFPAVVIEAEVRPQPEEVKAFAWLDYEAARGRITFPGSRRVLAEAWARLQV